jgi:RNA-directed DNA polymerase
MESGMKSNRPWFRSSGYKHLDVPIGEAFADKTAHADFVLAHSWLPLIKYTKRIKRYKPKNGKTLIKERPIMYASHRDACILKRYARRLTELLDKHYTLNNLDNTVIAYRKLGKANYDFSAEAFRFAKRTMPCVVLCFDITGFFDNLDHCILKDRLKQLLGVKELTPDWYAVFREVTKFKMIERSDLQKHKIFGPRLCDKGQRLIATAAEIIEAGIPIVRNPNKFGIPQGTPTSSAFSNLYLLDFDEKIFGACAARNALYQRYSDDILVICPLGKDAEIIAMVGDCLKEHKLQLAADKTDQQLFNSATPAAYQYLGFNVSPDGAIIRPSSLARQWRKAKRAIKTVEKVGAKAISNGKADKIFVSKLRRRFSPVGARNFSSYARRADAAFGSKKITRQITRLERRIDVEIRRLQKCDVTAMKNDKS